MGPTEKEIKNWRAWYERSGLAALPTPPRRRMPETRRALTRAVQIAGKKFYLTRGFYPDGTLGEIFLKNDKKGDGDAWVQIVAICISVGLSYGIPIETYINQLRGQKMIEPEGVTNDPEVPFCSSVTDYFARRLGLDCGVEL